MKISIPKLRDHFRKLREDLKPMTTWEKVDHIWTYYKEMMFVAFMVIMIFVAIIMSVNNLGYTLYASGVMSNTSLSIEGHDYLTDVFYEDVLGNPKKGRIQLTTSTLYVEYSDLEKAANETYQAYMGVLATIESKNLDYMLLDSRSFKFYVDEDIYMDLRELLPAEELQQLQEQGMLISPYAEGESAETAVPRGIDITSMDFAKDCAESDEQIILVFIRNTPRTDTCLKIWEHIKAWKPKNQ